MKQNPKQKHKAEKIRVKDVAPWSNWVSGSRRIFCPIRIKNSTALNCCKHHVTCIYCRMLSIYYIIITGRALTHHLEHTHTLIWDTLQNEMSQSFIKDRLWLSFCLPLLHVHPPSRIQKWQRNATPSHDLPFFNPQTFNPIIIRL